MIDPSEYLKTLSQLGVEFYAGVPDSLLKEFCACVTDTLNPNSHVIAANEGAAVGLAIGCHLGTGKVPMVYMQNSGLGNAVNPILSLASPEVYGIPMLLMIGWRGEPGVTDEPQHIHQGRVMMRMLEAMDIPAINLSSDLDVAAKQTSDAINQAKDIQGPIAMIVKKGTFGSYKMQTTCSNLELTREDAIISVASMIEPESVIVSTTGMASRELFEYRASNNIGHERDFLTVGGMGHASQIALGIAMSQVRKRVYCFDGDGAAIMHMGSLGVTGTSGCSNFVHIVFNNGVHGSVGGQPTVGFEIDLCQIAAACGYNNMQIAKTKEDIEAAINNNHNIQGPSFIEIQTLGINRNGIGRPTSSPAENKIALMKFLEITE